ncbi:unnamed protein product, partial [Larinioides sclopetarius]
MREPKPLRNRLSSDQILSFHEADFTNLNVSKFYVY